MARDTPGADPTLPAPAVIPTIYDPWEKYNRKNLHRFNNAVDRHVAKPLATSTSPWYRDPVRLGVRNFFNNLGQPISAVNALLQGKPKQAAESLGRFALHPRGRAGMFDPACNVNRPTAVATRRDPRYGAGGARVTSNCRCLVRGTCGDAFGMFGDGDRCADPHVEADRPGVLQGLQLVDVRTQLMAADSMREGAHRRLRRPCAMHGTRNWATTRPRRPRERTAPRRGPAGLPAGVRQQPQVPVDAMPVMPTDVH